jgi:fatty acid desaturase
LRYGAFFHRRGTNDWVGRAIGVLTLTPYDFWRRTHAVHHSTSGNLDRRGMGDIDTLTVQEYLALSRWGRLRYRIYRHPVIMFGLGPAYNRGRYCSRSAICIKDDLVTLLGLSKSPLIMECDRLLKRPKRADDSAIRE